VMRRSAFLRTSPWVFMETIVAFCSKVPMKIMPKPQSL
jgi:hypothetical protein